MTYHCWRSASDPHARLKPCLTPKRLPSRPTFLFFVIAALDNESEKVVQAALDEMQRTSPRTTLTVAHRLSTVKNCDKIVVLDRGGVKECGTHEELLQRKGLYCTLWQKQGGGGDKKED